MRSYAGCVDNPIEDLVLQNKTGSTISRQHAANAIRALSMDAVQKANSGHPGAPMGMADIAEVLWNDYLKHNPANPSWSDRDRFVLSNGHGSMLIYSLEQKENFFQGLPILGDFVHFGPIFIQNLIGRFNKIHQGHPPNNQLSLLIQ